MIKLKTKCCDRCGKEIEEKISVRTLLTKERAKTNPNGTMFNRYFVTCLSQQFEAYGFSKTHWELCYDCANALKQFMYGDDYNDEWDEILDLERNIWSDPKYPYHICRVRRRSDE